jgi:hypothetical protein
MAPHCEDSVVSIHQLKVTLATITPLIWRRLHVRSDATLAELHQVLQSAMGWENYHLHAFEVGWNRYGGGEGRDETAATLAGVLPKEGDGMIYTYDFGDEWQHVIDAREDPSAPPRHSVPALLGGTPGPSSPGLWRPVRLRRHAQGASCSQGMAATAKSKSSSAALTTPKPSTSTPSTRSSCYRIQIDTPLLGGIESRGERL